MSQEFQPHPVLVNYEANHDGVVRNRRLKKPIGFLNNQGYLHFNTGGKNHLCHRIAYECFHGLIKDGFVIDHIDSNCQNNKLINLQAISQSQNTKKGKTGEYAKFAKRVKSFDTETNEEKIFQSMNEAGRYLDICIASVRKVAEGIYQTALSKKNGHKIKFSYIKGDNSYSHDKSYVP